MSQRNTFRAAASAVALAFAAAGVTLVIAAPAAAQQASSAAGPVLQEASTLAQAGSFSAALTKLDELNGVEGVTQGDRALAEQIRMASLGALGRNAEAAAAAERAIAAGNPSAQIILKSRAGYLFAANNCGAAVTAADQYISRYGADSGMSDLKLACAARENPAALVEELQSAIRNQGATEERLRQLQGAAYQAGNLEVAQGALLSLLRSYPSEDYWNRAILSITSSPNYNDDNDVDIYRLMLAVGLPLTAEDYENYVALTLVDGLPGEAVRVLTEAKASGAIAGTERENRLLANAQGRVAADQAALPSLEAEARAAPTGQALVAVGRGYFGYGNYAKAAELIAAGIAKGGVNNEAAARLHLGIAQKRAGIATANAAFQSVTGDDGVEDIADLWTLVP